MAGYPEFRETHIPKGNLEIWEVRIRGYTLYMDKAAGVGKLRVRDKSLIGDLA